MSVMSPCLLLSPAPAAGPGAALLASGNLGPALALVLHAAASPEAGGAASSSACWIEPLRELAAAPAMAYGSPAELSAYAVFVRSKIGAAAALASRDATWAGSGLENSLQRALELVDAARTSAGRDLAVELIGFHALAQQLRRRDGNATFPGASLRRPPRAAASSAPAPPAAFKVPAPPAKRQRSPEAAAAQAAGPGPAPQPQQAAPQPQPAPQPGARRHSAPKRRATPQLLPGGPFSITPSAPPPSSAHGETVCDAQLLSCWCPISGKRQKCASPPAAEQQQPAGASSSPPQQPAPQQPAPSPSPARSSGGRASAGLPPRPAAPGAPAAGKPPTPTGGAGAPASARSDAIESVQRLMHEAGAASKPSPESLLFGKTSQLPVVNWTGAIKHRAGARVTELCTITLQVPEAFHEEMPRALYAAQLRHRRSVSLGRHVVCRASLAALSEHQLACLAAMARAQLVAVCSLQTAELHLVPYFDNRNLVRVVGFLKVKPQ